MPINNTVLDEAYYAELRGKTLIAWRKLSNVQHQKIFDPNKNKKNKILALDFIKRIEGNRIFFNKSYPIDEIHNRLTCFLNENLGSAELIYGTSAQINAMRSAERLQNLLEEPDRFTKLNFGDDVAERDIDLLQYFIKTKAFERVSDGKVSVIIGPKGSGKTAILKALQSSSGLENSIVITPEIFAPTILKQVIETNRDVWDEDQAFVSTWIFTILIEVFKRIAKNPRGVPTLALKSLRTFLCDNKQYEGVDIFTRFIGYLKRIEGVKIGSYELTLKTKMLQELYALSPIYELVPKLRGTGGEILILLDELDQGWDNTEHANRFIGSLIKAAIKIQSLGLKARVVTFLRLEIFNLIKGQLDQLDKLRSSIESLKWTDGELADLVVRRAAHSLSFTEPRSGFELEIATSLFEGQHKGMTGFEYLLSRTSLRPREVLQFLTHAHRLAVDAGHKKITSVTLKKAEEEFSAWKLEYMCAEYRHIYPKLNDLLWTFRAKGPMLTRDQVFGIIDCYKSNLSSELPSWVNDGSESLLQILFLIEFLGIPRPTPAKNRSGLVAEYEFAFDRQSPNVKTAPSFLVHPAMWATLEISSC